MATLSSLLLASCHVTYRAEAPDDLALLEVVLAVQVRGVDVADPGVVAGVQEDDVRRDHLVTRQVHEVADPDVLPRAPHVRRLRAANTMVKRLNSKGPFTPSVSLN